MTLPSINHRNGNPQPQMGVQVQKKWARDDYIFPSDLRISFSDEERRRIELEDIERTLLENKEVIKETFKAMKGIQDRVDCSRSFSCTFRWPYLKVRNKVSR